MSILTIGSIALALGDIWALWLVARKRRYGWLINIIVNTLWFPYDWMTHQYGFFALGVAYYWVSYQGWRHFHR